MTAKYGYPTLLLFDPRITTIPKFFAGALRYYGQDKIATLLEDIEIKYESVIQIHESENEDTSEETVNMKKK